MADASDVENALVVLVDSILYPNGDYASPITGVPTRIYRGWPNSEQLDPDLAAGVGHVSIFEAAGFARLTGGYLDGDATIAVAPTLTATVSTSNVVTLGGTPGLGQLVGVVVDGTPYAYALTATDTLATAASALAALVGGGVIVDFSGNQISGLTTDGYAVASGATIAFSTALPVIARTSAVGKSIATPRQQMVAFRITLWMPTTTARDAVASYLDGQMSAIRFITFSDGTSGRIMWRNTSTDDVPQKELLWKRDFLYTVQFATSAVTSAAQVLFELRNITPNTPSGTALAAAVQSVS
jgi:hypothetical protein